MARKLVPFKRADGLHEVVVLGNLGLSHVYNSSEKETHFVEDQEVGTDDVYADQYYIQLDDQYSTPAYNSEAIHLIKNITPTTGDATYEVFIAENDHEEDPDWLEWQCPFSDFEELLNEGNLVPMKLADVDDD